MRLRVAPQAGVDLDAIWRYIAEDSGSIDIATHEVDRIRDAFSLLLRFPELGRRQDAVLRLGLRSLIVDKYVVLYRIRAAEVQIVRVIHGSRDLHGLFSEG
jgi:toxin ParE1/3/4